MSSIVSRTQVEALNRRISQLKVELETANNALKLLQDLCEHDWKSAGHDSHYDYKKCTICDKTENE
jgi:predicted negative regulator of RcsB-dependent stress response